jgi:hypothetical protein
MKKKWLNLSFALVGFISLLIPTNAFSSTFSRVEARGTGCPLGSTDVIVSPDGSSASLLFNEMLIELPQFNGDNDNDVDVDGHGRGSRFDRNLVQKICNILVESQLPPDHKVESIDVKIDFRGSTFMDPGATAFFHSQLINITGPGRGSEMRRDFVARKIWREGPVEDDWLVSSTRSIKVKSNCSRHGDNKALFNLRNIIRANLTPQGQRNGSMVFIGLDSSDLVGKMEIKVNSRSCRGRGDRGDRDDRPTRPTKPGRDYRPTRPSRPGNPHQPGLGNCPRGTVFHPPARRCMTKREIALFGRRRF